MTAPASTSRSAATVLDLLRRLGEVVESRHTVAIAAAAAVLLRLPGLAAPLYADESGFLLVARSWDPRPGSIYGPYWVDRPPPLIAFVKACDALGGPYTLRILGALGCGLAVLLAARVGRLVGGERATTWTAVAVAALITNPLIDPVAVKGELLALPLVLACFWLTLLVARRPSVGLAFAAGLLGALAIGFKQNLLTGLVFAAVYLTTCWLDDRISRRDFLRLAGAGLAGAAVPVLATIGWALAAGVRLETLWYAVFGFRSDASRVIADGSLAAPIARAWVLVLVALGVGLVFIVGGFLVHLRGEWQRDKAIVAATLTVLLVDAAALAAGGSYWRDYLFPLIPASALCAALLARRPSKRGGAMRTVIALTAVSSIVGMANWLVVGVIDGRSTTARETGAAIAAAAEPGDTLVVFGGGADLQYASGLTSPYRFLWSLPMRTLDPQYAELRALLTGPDAPTWLVVNVPFTSWGAPGAPALVAEVDARYVEQGTGCGGRPVYLLRGAPRPALDLDCP